MQTRRILIQCLGALALADATQVRAQPSPGTVRIEYVPVIGASALFGLVGAGWAREVGLAIRTTKFDPGPNAIQATAKDMS